MPTPQSGKGPQGQQEPPRPLSPFSLPRLYPILDPAHLAQRASSSCTPLDAASAMLDAGARILQLRHKGAYTRAMFALAQSLGELCQSYGAVFAINDRADIAALTGAPVVHVGQDDLPPSAVASVYPGAAAIGLSTHNEAQFLAAIADPAAGYLAIGPIFATVSKENPDPVVGLGELARLAAHPLRRERGLPLVAIGGITLERAPSVWQAGADSIAVIGALVPEQASASDIFRVTSAWCNAADML